jgi:ribonuclease T1
MSRVRPRTLLVAAGIVIAALLAVFAVDLWSGSPPATAPPAAVASGTPHSGLPTVDAGDLPPQAISVLALIDRGGPFPYAQDNTTFSNNEGLLPWRPRGYYREYTVVTPGSADRGTRRLIVGRDGDVYYTSDHYASFRQVTR